jgi:hypothetical protein
MRGEGLRAVREKPLRTQGARARRLLRYRAHDTVLSRPYYDIVIRRAKWHCPTADRKATKAQYQMRAIPIVGPRRRNDRDTPPIASSTQCKF